MHIVIFIILALVVMFILPRPSRIVTEGYGDTTDSIEIDFEVPEEDPMDQITEREKRRLMKVVMNIVRKYRLNQGDMKIICSMMMADKSGATDEQMRDMMMSIPSGQRERLKRIRTSMQGDAFAEGMRPKDWGMLCTLVMARGDGGGEGDGPMPPRYKRPPPPPIMQPPPPPPPGGPGAMGMPSRKSLIGKPLSVVKSALAPFSSRFDIEYLRQGTLVTREYRSNRIRVFYDASNIVTNITMG